MTNRSLGTVLLLAAGLGLTATAASALVMDVTIEGSDAIFLAGRTDITIPAASDPWNYPDGMQRHSYPTPEEIQETFPSVFSITAGDVLRVLDPAVGGYSLAGRYLPSDSAPSVLLDGFSVAVADVFSQR